MNKIKKGDTVQVLLGKDNGKTGKVDRVLTKSRKVLVEAVNMYKRHVKSQGQTAGGVIDIRKPVDISNVVLVCPSCKKTTRVGFRVEGDVKIRFCKKCKKEVK